MGAATPESRMISNGVFLPELAVAVYWNLSVKDSLTLLKNSLVEPYVQIDGREYYFRPDVWGVHRAYQKFLNTKYPTHLRAKLNLVCCDDVAVFYELSRASASKLLKKHNVPPWHFGESRKTQFFKYADVTALERRLRVFSAASASSGNCIKANIRSGFHLFRDWECSYYEECSMFAIRTSDYMNCSLCRRHGDPQASGLDVFTPRNSVTGVNSVEEYIKNTLGGDLGRLPNALVSKK